MHTWACVNFSIRLFSRASREARESLIWLWICTGKAKVSATRRLEIQSLFSASFPFPSPPLVLEHDSRPLPSFPSTLWSMVTRIKAKTWHLSRSYYTLLLPFLFVSISFFPFFPERIVFRLVNFYRATRVKRVKTLFPRILRFFEYFSSVVNRFKYPLINFQRFLFVRNQSIQSHSIVTPCIFFQVSKVSRSLLSILLSTSFLLYISIIPNSY